MNSNSSRRRKVGDPLLNSCDDGKTEFCNLLGVHVEDGSFVFHADTDSHNDVGSWLQNSSMSELSTDVSDSGHNVTLSEGTFLSLNPDSGMPLQTTLTPQKLEEENAPEIKIEDTEEDMADTVDSASGLHEEPMNVDTVTSAYTGQLPASEQQPKVQHIQIVAIHPSNLVSVKSGTLIMDSNTGGVIPVTDAAFIQASSNVQSFANDKKLLQPVQTQSHSDSSSVLVKHLQRNVPILHRLQPQTLTNFANPLKVGQANATEIQPYSDQEHTLLANIHQGFSVRQEEEKVYERPMFSYGCLIALALKNSSTGSLPVNEIYDFVCEHFPYYRTARDGWKNSVRHNLSMSKSFMKVHDPSTSGTKKGCLWGMNPDRVKKMDEEVAKCIRKNLNNLYATMAHPEKLTAIQQGQAGLPSHKNQEPEDEEELEEDEFPGPVTEPLKAELTSTPRKGAEEMVEENTPSPLSNDLEQEYAAHALEWCISDADIDNAGINNADIDNVDIDLLTSSPVDFQHSSPPHMPSSSVAAADAIAWGIPSDLTSNPFHLFVRCTPSSVKSELLEATSPRTVPAFQA